MTPEQFLQLARVLPEPTCLVTDEGRLLAANPPAAKLLGLPAGTSQTILLTDLVADDAEKITEYVRDCSQGATMSPAALFLRLTDGSERLLHCEGAAVAPRSGEAPALVLLRFGVEEEIESAGRRFQMFMENLPGLAWMKDLAGRYVYANSAAAEAFGKTRAELYGKTDEEVFPPETARQFRENDLRALEGGARVHTLETLEQEDGVHYSIVSKFPVLGPGGEADSTPSHASSQGKG